MTDTEKFLEYIDYKAVCQNCGFDTSLTYTAWLEFIEWFNREYGGG